MTVPSESSHVEGRVIRNGHVERVDPETAPRGVMAVHLARYTFSVPYAAGRTVLDVACGAGYGTALLSESARWAVGVDLSEEAVRYARARYPRNNAAFFVGDAQRLPFMDAAFETVVSFETIEHLSRIPEYLEEVRRVLRPGGVFVVSTPKARQTTLRPANPHHTIEYAARDFRRLLERHFRFIELYSQIRVEATIVRWMKRMDRLGVRRWLPRGLRRSVHGAFGSRPFEEMDASDQKIVPGELRHAEYMVAVCTK